MDISNLYEMVHGTILKKDLVQIITTTDEQLKRYNLSLDLTTSTQISNLAEYLEVDIQHFYINTKGMSQFVYYNNGVLAEIYNWSIEDAKIIKLKERIHAQTKYINDNIVKEKFHDVFTMVDKRILLITYQDLFDLIPDNDKYLIFRDIYVRLEYGFNYIEQDFVEKVLQFRKKDKGLKNKLNKICDSNGYITIYRGMGNLSTTIESAYSWTTNLYTALFFAVRFEADSNGRVYLAKIHKNKVIDYINNRNEFEILAQYNDLQDVKLMNFYNFVDINDELTIHKVIDKYILYCEKISDKNFKDPISVHGKLHTKRVLLLSLILAYYEKLNTEDKDILACAAVYHDIGRINDNVCYKHGEYSISKMLSQGIIKDVNTSKNQILKYIIENHCINDEQAFINIEKYNITDKNRALKLLKVFKDADGLDRVRIKDLDIKYLRTETAKKLPLVAQQLLKGIK